MKLFYEIALGARYYLSALLILFSISVYAADPIAYAGDPIANVKGTITAIYADQDQPWTFMVNKSDVVFSIQNQPGPCGSGLYHIQRTNTNFKEFYGIVLSAFLVGKNISVDVGSCASNRNIAVQGAIY